MTNAIRLNGTYELSSDINVANAEIDMRQSLIGESIFEIGRWLKHVKESDLTHGNYMPWLAERKIEHTVATRMIKAYEQFGDVATSQGLDTSKIYEMLSLPVEVDRAEFIQTPHEIPSTGETKVVDAMTVKELREVKAELKKTQAERDAEREAREQAVASESVAMELASGFEDELAEAKARAEMVQAAAESAVAVEVEPIVIEKEVIPEDVQRRLDELEAENNRLGADNKQMDQSLARNYERISHLERLEKTIQSQEESPMYDLIRSLQTTNRYFDTFTARRGFLDSAIASAEQSTVDTLETQLRRVFAKVEEVLTVIDERNGVITVEAEFTDTVVGQTTIYDAEIIEVEADKPLSRAEEKMLTVLAELSESGEGIRIDQIAKAYECTERNAQTHLQKSHVIAAYESLGIVRRGSAATEYIFQKADADN